MVKKYDMALFNNLKIQSLAKCYNIGGIEHFGMCCYTKVFNLINFQWVSLMVMDHTNLSLIFPIASWPIVFNYLLNSVFYLKKLKAVFMEPSDLWNDSSYQQHCRK